MIKNILTGLRLFIFVGFAWFFIEIMNCVNSDPFRSISELNQCALKNILGRSIEITNGGEK